MLGLAAVFAAGMLGVALMVDDEDPALASEDDSGTGDTDPPAVDDPPSTPAETVTYDANGDLTGTNGADILNDLWDDALNDNNPGTANLLGGNDIVIDTDHGDWQPDAINGGAGDDQIMSDTIGVTIHGDSGNDMIAGVPGAQLYGDDGDDRILVDLTHALNDSVGRADGGDGDDTIEVVTEISAEPVDDFSSVVISGGEGADDITLELQSSDSYSFTPTQDEPTPDPVEAPSGIVIQDFDRAEDILTIEIADGLADYESFEVVNHPDQDRSEIVIHYRGDSGFPAITTSISVLGIGDLTTSDFVLMS